MLTRNLAWKLSSYALGGGCYFIFTLLLIRRLGPTEYGKLAFALGWAGLFAILIDYGFNSILSRDLAQAPEKGAAYWTWARKAKLLLGLAAFAAMLLFSQLHPQARRLLALSLLALGFLGINSFMETAQAVTYAYERFRDGAILSVAHKWFIAVLGGLALWMGWGTERILLGMVAGAALGALVMLRYFRHFFIDAADADRISLWREAFPLFLQNIFIIVYFRIDTIMLSWMAGDRQTGWYNAAYRFFELSNVLPTALVAVLIAPMTRQIRLGEWIDFFRKYLTGFVVLAGIGCLILQGAAYALPRYFLGPAFGPSQGVLRVLALTLLFYYPNYLLTTMLVLLKRQAANAWVAVFCVLFNISTNWYAIPRWGAMGAAWMTLATEAVITTVSIALILRWGKNSSAA